jgi:hypothetical protein
VSSRGVSNVLTSEKEFVAFKALIPSHFTATHSGYFTPLPPSLALRMHAASSSVSSCVFFEKNECPCAAQGFDVVVAIMPVPGLEQREPIKGKLVGRDVHETTVLVTMFRTMLSEKDNRHIFTPA